MLHLIVLLMKVQALAVMKIPATIVCIGFCYAQMTVAYAADPILKSGEEHEQECIADMKLTEAQVMSGLYKYQVDRCIASRVSREGAAQKLERLRLRQERLGIQSRISSRNGKRFLSKKNQERFNLDYDANNRRSYAISARARRQKLLDKLAGRTQREAREDRALLRRQRNKEAREACKDSPRSFYSNCVRDKYREIGSK